NLCKYIFLYLFFAVKSKDDDIELLSVDSMSLESYEMQAGPSSAPSSSKAANYSAKPMLPIPTAPGQEHSRGKDPFLFGTAGLTFAFPNVPFPFCGQTQR